jgi:hypothetical protein
LSISPLYAVIRQNGKELFVWTVNDESEMQRMIDLGANAIITNDPVTCRNLVSSDSQTGVMGILNRLKTGIVGLIETGDEYEAD